MANRALEEKEENRKIPTLSREDYSPYEWRRFQQLAREQGIESGAGITPDNYDIEDLVLDIKDGHHHYAPFFYEDTPETREENRRWLERNTPPTQLWKSPYEEGAHTEGDKRDTSSKRYHKLKEPKDANKHQTKEYK